MYLLDTNISSEAVDTRKWSAMWRDQNISHILLFDHNRRITAAKEARNICTVYGHNATGQSIARKWFSSLKEDHFDIIDSPHSRRSLGFDDDHVNKLIHNDPYQCTPELANVLNCDHSTIVQRLHAMGKVQKLCVWVQHALSQNHKNQQVAICGSLLACHQLAREQHQLVLSCIITCDKKWCIYVNIRKRKEWLTLNKAATPRTKPSAHTQQIMLCTSGGRTTV
ncbi:histone-lysine N-methyltransferase SETMAR-like [Schistocerca serialis cubense]|uniref:histone-lysine N-methyltransferase SETMAR-like n=1 Tax=Schistocerca serialis cubense TaxID=2023355 RepID=UPI00214EF8A9|nr:histone-lysine N-methyltransferase SETMAR-like [Schistocerca serialis cubense]